MIYTLVLGSPVQSGDGKLGTLTRIILNNGVANQLVVNPSGLFSGPERVVPINDVQETSPESITLDITDVEWKAYGTFNISQLLVSDQAAAPGLIQQGPASDVNRETIERPTAEAVTDDATTTANSVVLTIKTRVGDHGHLAGLVADTGIPQQLLLDNGETIAFDQVGVLDENHIVLGEAPPRLDDVTHPGSIGQDAPGGQPTQ